MTRITRWMGAALVLMVASCGARDMSNANELDASASTPSYAPTPEQQVRAAYVSARQAEGASDPVYAFHRTGNAMEATHPDSQMHALVDGDGVTLSRAGEAWTARLHTANIGCQGATGSGIYQGTTISHKSNRVQVDKTAGDQHVTEWYTQGALGLEQGWTLHDNPCATGQLEIDLKVAGLAVVDGKVGLELRDETGLTKVHYTDAWARDAKGRALETTMTAAGATITIHVDTRAATFPIEVDPLAWFQQQELTASDGATGDNFGASVAVSGPIAIVGAPFKTVGSNATQGAAYVFVQSGATWSQQQELTASDGTKNDAFGYSVTLSGGTAVVAAPYKIGSATNQGAAYVFVQNGTTWTQQQKLTASDAAAFDYFGRSVALSGGTVVVGTPSKTVGGNTSQGVAYVFVQSGTSWSQQQKLIASDGAASDEFGRSVALSGGTAVVGAHYKKVGANASQGAAYVFVQNGTTWTQQQTLTASDGATNDYFGYSVAVSGGTAIAGAFKTVGANSGQGAAYVFVQSGTSWTQQQKLIASDGAGGDWFGRSVAMSGGTAVVGAYYKTFGANTNQGAAYVFVQSGTTWIQQQELTPSDGATNDYFGDSVAVASNTAIVGASTKKVGVNGQQGAAYVFNQGPPNAIPCIKPSDCGSGFCVDGVCCDTACTGVCQACAASVKQSATADGTCGPALNGTNPHKDPCPADAPASCGRDGLCDGVGACRLHPPAGTTCATACAADQETDSTCNASSMCTLGSAVSCGKYHCDSTRCKTSCATAADCVAGFTCQAGACVATGGTCVGNELHGTDGTVVNCAPYRCDPSGCKLSCKSVDDCVAPAACDPSGKCASPAASNSAGCSTSTGSGTTAGIGAFLLMGMITRLRRRSRRNRKMS